MIEMVDALGGITVYSPVAFTTLHGGYQIHKGNNEMDGDKALGFVRERYGYLVVIMIVLKISNVF